MSEFDVRNGADRMADDGQAGRLLVWPETVGELT